MSAATKMVIEIPIGEDGRPAPAEVEHIFHQIKMMLMWQMNPREWKKIETAVNTGYGRAEVKVI
jgi:hypothetical protein